jgi:hypothetical protein
MATYPLAMQAIAEFRYQALSVLERVAKQRATAVSQIVGKTTILRYSEEVDAFLENADTALSVSTGGPCYFTIGIWWRDVGRQPAPVRIFASLSFDKRATFEKVDKTLQDRFRDKFTTDDEEKECYLEKPIKPKQIDQLELELGKISDRWIRMLRASNVRKLVRSKS